MTFPVPIDLFQAVDCMIDSDLARSPQAARPLHNRYDSTLKTVGSPLSRVSKRSCRSGTKMVLCRVLENDYQRLVPLRQRGLGVIGAWEGIASVQPPFLISAASSAMPPRLIFFSVVLGYLHELYQSVKCRQWQWA